MTLVGTAGSAAFHGPLTEPDQGGGVSAAYKRIMWLPIHTAPFDAEIELAVIDREGPHALVFPCRRALRGWLKAESGEKIAVHPTHWRHWDESRAARGEVAARTCN